VQPTEKDIAAETVNDNIGGHEEESNKKFTPHGSLSGITELHLRSRKTAKSITGQIAGSLLSG
jgi:hypothetical protein